MKEELSNKIEQYFQNREPKLGSHGARAAAQPTRWREIEVIRGSK